MAISDHPIIVQESIRGANLILKKTRPPYDVVGALVSAMENVAAQHGEKYEDVMASVMDALAADPSLQQGPDEN